MNKAEALVDYAKAIADEHRIDFSKVLDVICEALAITIRRKYEKSERNFKVKIDPETYKVTIYRVYKVVETVHYPTKEISLEAALLEDPNIQEGHEIIDEDENEEIIYDRVSYSTIKQVITNRIRELKRDKIIEAYEPFLGQMVYGTVKRATANSIIVTLPESPCTKDSEISNYESFTDQNSIEAIIPKEGLIPNKKPKTNESICAIYVQVRAEKDNNTKKMILSCSTPEFVKEILAKNIPEIEDGDIKIEKIVREPGVRAKAAVSSQDPNIDVIGACVGVNSSRIESVNRALGNERVDIIHWTDNYSQNIIRALAQKEYSNIYIDEARNTIDVFVDKNILSPAIGRSGINVRLASRLLGKKIRVHSQENYEDFEKNKLEENKGAIQSLEKALNIETDSAKYLISHGFTSIEVIASTELEELEEYIDTEEALYLINKSKETVNKQREDQANFILNADIDEELMNLSHITNDILVKLISNGITSLDKLADLSNADLEPYMSKKIASSLIMEARDILWFENKEKA